MTLAKSLCGGIAGGAMLTTAEIAPSLRPGMHAATFGGNPIAARAGIACIEMIESQNLLQNVANLSQLFQQRLQALEENCQWIREVRIVGMMIGIELDVEGGAVVEACMANGLLVNCTQGNIVRLLPAMTLTEDQAEQGCQILADAIQGLDP